MKITIVGAGNVGASAAKAIADKGIVNEIVLIDIVEGVPQGKALDITQSAPCVGFDTKVIGTNNYADTANSDIVVITAGVARKPGMSRDDLLNINAGIIGGVVQQVAKSSPNSIIIAVTNPLDVMAYLAYKVSGFPKNRVIGMAGVLDTSRFRAFIAAECNVSVRDVYAFVLGGHGDSMVPCVDFTTVAGVPLKQILSQDKIDAIVKRAQNGGGEIVALLKTGSAYYAPAQSVTEMVEAIVLDTNRILPCAAYLDGEYGIKGGYCGVPCKLGKGGLKEIVKVNLTAKEAELLKKSGEEVLSQIKAMEVLEGYTKLGIK
jgi:malate dehydrogenase